MSGIWAGPAADPVFGPDAFAGRRVIVTGGASGIGAALCEILVSCGASVALLDLNEHLAADVAVRLGDAVRAFSVDVGDERAATAAIVSAAKWLGGIDGLANVAGTVRPSMICDGEVAPMLVAMAVNLYGPLYTCRAAVPFLRQATNPSIVNVASQAASQAYPGGGLYGPSKAGLVALTKQFALELAREGIRANVVSPGSIDTPMAQPVDDAGRRRQELRDSRLPLGRRGHPREVAATIAFLLSTAASYITAQQINVGGGLDQTVLPGPLSA
jgi:NAD(P)-dependent dehydrogenase (short-subunit alcohol dehydrogenase family)